MLRAMRAIPADRELGQGYRASGGAASNAQTSRSLPTGHIAVEGPVLSCTSNGSAGGKRTAGWCVSPAGDLSCAMGRSGYALRWDRHWKRHGC